MQTNKNRGLLLNKSLCHIALTLDITKGNVGERTSRSPLIAQVVAIELLPRYHRP